MVFASTKEGVGRPRSADAWLRRWVRGDPSLAEKTHFALVGAGMLEELPRRMVEYHRRGLLQWIRPGLLFLATMEGGVTLLDLTRSFVARASTDWVLGCSHSPAPLHHRSGQLHRGRLYPSHLYRDYALILGE